MLIEPWRLLSEYTNRANRELTKLLREESGVYLIAQATPRADQIKAMDIVYIGLAGEAGSANGKFYQRIQSHVSKLRNGANGTSGCPRVWEAYHQKLVRSEPEQTHALRLIRMDAKTADDKRKIGQWEDVLLLLWARFARANTNDIIEMPLLNTKRPSDQALLAMLEGPIRSGDTESPNQAKEPPFDDISDIWQSDEDATEQEEKLAQYRDFFIGKGQEHVWRNLESCANKHSFVWRVINIGRTTERPGQLRLTRFAQGEAMVKRVQLILMPDTSAKYAQVQLLIEPNELKLPQQLELQVEKHSNGRIRSIVRAVPLDQVIHLVQAAIDHSRK